MLIICTEKKSTDVQNPTVTESGSSQDPDAVETSPRQSGDPRTTSEERNSFQGRRDDEMNMSSSAGARQMDIGGDKTWPVVKTIPSNLSNRKHKTGWSFVRKHYSHIHDI